MHRFLILFPQSSPNSGPLPRSDDFHVKQELRDMQHKIIVPNIIPAIPRKPVFAADRFPMGSPS